MSTLVNRNIIINGRRTSMRLEPEMWDALQDIGSQENMKISQICTMVDRHRKSSSLTSAVRVFIISYFRAVALGKLNQRLNASPIHANSNMLSSTKISTPGQFLEQILESC